MGRGALSLPQTIVYTEILFLTGIMQQKLGIKQRRFRDRLFDMQMEQPSLLQRLPTMKDFTEEHTFYEKQKK